MASSGSRADEGASQSRCRILILSIGTEGDVRPAVALAKRLLVAGFDVAVVTHTHRRDLVESSGSNFLDIGPCLAKQRAETDAGRALSEASTFNMLSRAKAFMGPLVERYAQASYEAVKSFRPDYTVFSTLAWWTSFHAVKAAVGSVDRACILSFMPMLPSDEIYPCVGFASVTPVRVRFLCRGIWSAARSAGWSLYKGPVMQALGRVQDPQRSCTGLRAEDNPFDSLRAAPHIMAYSPSLFTTRPTDWPSHVQVVGAIREDATASTAQISEELQRFASSGGKPLVFIGLGSMLHCVFSSAERRAEVQQLLVDLAGLASVRAVVQLTDDFQPAQPQADVFELRGNVSYAWLFPQCRVVLTHGGCGTVHSALAAGCPTLVLACEPSSDQPFWGQTVSQMSVGRSAGFDVTKLTSRSRGKLADVLREMANDDGLKQRAEAMARSMQSEHALDSAVDLLRSWTARSTPSFTFGPPAR